MNNYLGALSITIKRTGSKQGILDLDELSDKFLDDLHL